MKLQQLKSHIFLRIVLVAFSSFIAIIALYKFWYFDQINIQFTPPLLVSIADGFIPSLVPYLALAVLLVFITFIKDEIRLKLLILMVLSALLQLPLIYAIQKYPISIKTISLHAVGLSFLLSIYFYIWLRDLKSKRLCQKKNLSLMVFLVFTIIYSVFVLVRHYSFNSNAQDLGVYLQTVYELGHSTEPLLTNWYGNIHPFAVHFEPILYFFVPFEYFNVLPPVMLISQVLGATLGIIGIFKIADLFNLSQVVPFLISIIYGISAGIQHGIIFDFHTTMLMPSFIIFLFYYILKGNTKAILILAALFLLIKEDTALYTVFFGIYTLLVTKNFKLGSALILYGSIYSIVVVGKVIPEHGQGEIANFVLDRLGGTLSEALSAAINKPIRTLRIFFTPFAEKMSILASTLLHGGLSTLWGYKELLLLLPLFGMRFFTSMKRMWGFSMYYAAPTIAVVSVATIVGYKKLSKKRWHLSLFSLIYGAVFSFLLGTMIHIPGYYSSSIFRKFLKPNFFSGPYNNQAKTVREALKIIPKTASVCASQSISPHISTRTKTTFLGSAACDDSYDYILINVDFNNWPLSNKELANKLENLAKDSSYSLVFSREGTVLFSRNEEVSSELSDYLRNWLDNNHN